MAHLVTEIWGFIYLTVKKEKIMEFLLGMFTGWLLTHTLKYLKRRIRIYRYANRKGKEIDAINAELGWEKIDLNKLINK